MLNIYKSSFLSSIRNICNDSVSLTIYKPFFCSRFNVTGVPNATRMKFYSVNLMFINTRIHLRSRLLKLLLIKFFTKGFGAGRGS